MIKEQTDKHINKIPWSPNQYEIQKFPFVGFFISLREYYQYDWKYHPKETEKNIYRYNTYSQHGDP